MATEKIVTMSVLQYYDTKLKAWVTTELDEAIAGLGNVFTLKTRVDNIEALPAEGNNAGDIYLVGAEGSASFDEYYWNGSKWELMGTTATDISNCVTKTDLYEGAEGTGTVGTPAEGTIIATIYAKIAAVQAEVDAAEERIAANETAIAANLASIEAINNADTGILAQAKAYADTKDTAIEAAQTAADKAQGEVDALELVVAEVKATADGAVQEVASGTANGTVAVDGVDVAVTGLGTAAYKADTYFEVAGAAATAQSAAKEYADGLNTAMDTRVTAAEEALNNLVTEEDVDSWF